MDIDIGLHDCGKTEGGREFQSIDFHSHHGKNDITGRGLQLCTCVREVEIIAGILITTNFDRKVVFNPN